MSTTNPDALTTTADDVYADTDAAVTRAAIDSARYEHALPHAIPVAKLPDGRTY